MALNTAQKDKKRHRDRKNPRSHDLYKEENRAQNKKRPKQRWIQPRQFVDNMGHTIVEGGHWTRGAI